MTEYLPFFPFTVSNILRVKGLLFDPLIPRGSYVPGPIVIVMRWVRQIIHPQCLVINHLGHQMIPGRKQISIELVVWPKAPEVEVIKAAMLCQQYGLNPLRKHIKQIVAKIEHWNR